MNKPSNSRQKNIAVVATSFCKSEALVRECKDRLKNHNIQFNSSAIDLSGRNLVDALKESDIAIVGRETIDAEVLAALPRLRAIAKYGVGLDNLDHQAMAQRGVVLFHESGVNRFAVAELTIGLMIGLLRKIAVSDRALRQGIWAKDGGRQLYGSKVGIIGCGAVGSELARMLTAFSCKLLLTDIVDISPLAKEVHGEMVDYTTALKNADIISFHVPLTKTTHHMFGMNELALLRQDTVVINTSRGEVLSEAAVIHGLKSGIFAGAAFDVFENEPLINPALATLPNFLGTAHIAGNSREAVWSMGLAAIRGVEKFLQLP